MAVSIRHGHNGSYKTALTMQTHLIPALKEGRIVVTNIEGLYPLDELECVLGVTFPESARLFRISSQKTLGRELWCRFFHWCPLGSMIIIDEAQDIFTNDKKTFDPGNYNLLPVSEYRDKLPEDIYSAHIEALQTFKPKLDSSMTDDLNEQITDENGQILYPPTFREAFNRHRKFDWDIVLVTPYIDNISKFIRGLCEMAYSHKSKDGLKLPYFKRRPRVLEHPPLESGLTAKKGDKVTWPKVHLDVFRAYKSTQTGKVKKSGEGTAPIPAWKITFVFFMFGSVAIYWTYYFNAGTEPDNSAKKNMETGVSATEEVVYPRDSVRTDALQPTDDAELALPYDAHSFYIDGIVEVRQESKTRHDVTFIYKIASDDYVISSRELILMGFKIVLLNECNVSLFRGDLRKTVYCKPRLLHKKNNEAEDVKIPDRFKINKE